MRPWKICEWGVGTLNSRSQPAVSIRVFVKQKAAFEADHVGERSPQTARRFRVPGGPDAGLIKLNMNSAVQRAIS